MDPGPSNASSEVPRCICICRQYCGGEPRVVSDTTFYRHLKATEDNDEQRRMMLVKPLSLDAAQNILNANLFSQEQTPDNQPGPSSGISRYARRLETQQAIAKRAREAPESQGRAGKRKCARPNNRSPSRPFPQSPRPQRSPSPDYPFPDPDAHSGCDSPTPDRSPSSDYPFPDPDAHSGRDSPTSNHSPSPSSDRRSPEPDDQSDPFGRNSPTPDRSPSPDRHSPDPDAHSGRDSPTPDRSPSPNQEPPPRNRPRRIAYNRRRPLPIDFEELSRVTVFPKLQQNLDFVFTVRNASFADPLAKFTTPMLERLRNPPETPIQLNNPGIQFSIETYLGLEHASQNAYSAVIQSAKRHFSGAPGVADLLSFQAVENLIAVNTGIEPVEHDMCINSCIGFTGPFANLDECPVCEAPRKKANGDPVKTFITLPLGPQLQAIYRNPDSALEMRYFHERTQAVLNEYEIQRKITIIDDVVSGWDSLGSSLAGDIQENDIVVMASIDGAQLYEDKDSDCWLYIWLILNLAPDKRYRKTHVLPGGFIPGPNKPKNVDSFIVVGIHHLAALQKEGLKIWDSSRDVVYRSQIYFLFATADGPGLTHWDGLVGHCGKNGCRIYCGVRGRHKDARSHYYPALLCPQDPLQDSNHPDISPFHIPPTASHEYMANLTQLMSSPNQRQFDLRRTETGITKAPLILGLDPKHSLGVPLCLTTDMMHLAANISQLLVSLWRGTITCLRTDNIETWDWAIFRDEQVWQDHGRAVEAAGLYLPGSFDVKPRNIAAKINTDYKTAEFCLYTFGLAPGLLYGILPEKYWLNFCKLVRGFQLICQHRITHKEALEACALLASWELEFEEIYYQRRNDRLHFIRPCVHQVLHLAPETFQKGPSICTAQWTIERTIGNLKQEIRQPSNYLVNFCKEGVRRARVNALLAAIPTLGTPPCRLPNGAEDLGSGYALLRKRDKTPMRPTASTEQAIQDFLGHDVLLPKIRRWARLQLPNSQIARSAWREEAISSEKLRVSRMVKFKRNNTFRIGEVFYFTRITVENEGRLEFANVALIRVFSPPDDALLRQSRQTFARTRITNEILVVPVQDIMSVVAMVPQKVDMEDFFFCVQKPGFGMSHYTEGNQNEGDEAEQDAGEDVE